MARNEYMKEYNKKYLKTKTGFVGRLYTKMQSRIRGTHGHNSVYYVGKEIMNRKEFYEWISKEPSFHDMFQHWVDSGYVRSLVPTIDRIDPKKGYIKGNVEVVTFIENVYRSHKTRRLRK